jgi:hypothetical protein
MVTPSQTIFVVFNPAALPASLANFVGGPTGSIALGIGPSGSIILQITNITGIGGSTALLTPGTWTQFNTAYDGSTFSYRVNRTADASGSSSNAAGSVQSGFGWNGSSPDLPADGLLAEFIYYNRVLTLTQRQAVEAYLHTKWGV